MNWLDKHQKATRNLSLLSAEIKEMSMAFDAVGNEKVSLQLLEIAKEIADSKNACANAISEMITEQLNQSQKEINDTFLTALKGKSK